MEARGALARQRLVVGQPEGARALHGPLIERHGLHVAAIESRRLGREQPGAALEIGRTVRRPVCQLGGMAPKSIAPRPLFAGRTRQGESKPSEQGQNGRFKEVGTSPGVALGLLPGLRGLGKAPRQHAALKLARPVAEGRHREARIGLQKRLGGRLVLWICRDAAADLLHHARLRLEDEFHPHQPDTGRIGKARSISASTATRGSPALSMLVTRLLQE